MSSPVGRSVNTNLIVIIAIAAATVIGVILFTSRPQTATTSYRGSTPSSNNEPSPMLQALSGWTQSSSPASCRADRAYKTLDNVWDMKGLTIYRDTYVVAQTYPRQLIKFPKGGLTAYISNYAHPQFWQDLETQVWAPEIWDEFHYLIDERTTYVDFGTWIGPTVLYGAQLARRTFGIEADPAAFAKLAVNHKFNADAPWYRSVHLQPGCVHVEDNSVNTMRTKNLGDSGSSMGKVHMEVPGENLHSWQVRCYTLASYFKLWDINPEEEHVFVKVDVESYECNLIPSFLPWLKNMKQKPTILLGMHSQITRCTDQQYAEIAKVAALYKYVTPGFVSTDGKTIIGHTRDFVLSDVHIWPHLTDLHD